MNSKKDHKLGNSKRTTPKEIVPSNLLSKFREPITFKNTADYKDMKDIETKDKNVRQIGFDLWPENIDKYIDTTNKETFKEKNYDYITSCVDSKLVWKKPQQFFKMINRDKADNFKNHKPLDDMELLTSLNLDLEYYSTKDDIRFNPQRKNSSTSEHGTEIQVSKVIDKKILIEQQVETKDNKSKKKKTGEKEYNIVKEIVLSNLTLDDNNNHLINWVTSCLQTIIDQNIPDCEVF